jgi:hypothetical protein
MSTANPTSEHAWFIDHIATYLAGGLDAAHAARFAAHRDQCAECRAELERCAQADATIQSLLADAVPPAGLEDRIISRLRETPVRRLVIPRSLIHIVGAVAAVLTLGVCGQIVSSTVLSDRPVVAASNLRQIGLATPMYANESRGAFDGLGRNLSYSLDAGKGAAGRAMVAGQSVSYGDGHVDWVATPFVGVQKDNIYAGDAGREPAQSARLPGLQGQDDKDHYYFEQSAKADQPVQLGERFKPVDVMAAAEAADKEDEKLTEVGRATLALAEPMAGAAPPAQAQPPAPVPSVEQAAAPARKVIRNGKMEFEVDSFDSAAAQVASIVAEEGGFVSTTTSEKLPNGKTRGSIILRVPPERLDTLILKLRALGNLISQQIGAEDVTKHYTDLEGELRAARAMEERLLEIIKTGQGQIKDLLEAEKQLGVWRTKIEKLLGEIRYYDSQVALATLILTLVEKDILDAAAVSQTETVTAGVEADDVAKARTDAIAAIEQAKGRVIESDLKQHDAGQFEARVLADVPADATGPLIDRLRQLGRVARLDVQRRQEARDGRAVPAGARVERRDARFAISIYNLANVAPRQTHNIDLACADVEAAYQQALAQVAQASGRVIVSQISHEGNRASGNLSFEVPQAGADVVLASVRGLGEVMRSNVAENADTANSTSAKRGFVLRLVSINDVPPRETTALGIEVPAVEAAAADVQTQVLAAGGRVLAAQHSRERSGQASALVIVEFPLSQSVAMIDRIKAMGIVRTTQSSRNLDVPGTGELARARLELTLGSPDTLVSGERGFWHSVREGLATSITGVLWSIRLIVIGLCFVLPWAILIWLTWRVIGRVRGRASSAQPGSAS